MRNAVTFEDYAFGLMRLTRNSEHLQARPGKPEVTFTLSRYSI